MNKFLKVIKVLISTLVTMIILLGSIFIVLFFIGIEPYVVETGSMEPAIQRGSLSFINKHEDYNNIKVNDVIAFSLPTGKKATHRVVKKTERGFETKGDSNDVPDGVITNQANYIGKNVFSIPKLGYVIILMQSAKGKIIMGMMILILLVLGLLFGENKKGKRFKE